MNRFTLRHLSRAAYVAIFLGFIGSHDVVAVRILFNSLNGLTGMAGEYAIQNGDFTRPNGDFNAALENAGFCKRKTKKGAFFYGLKLKEGQDFL